MRVPVAYHLAPGIWIPINWLEPEDMASDSYAEYHYNLDGGYIEISKRIPIKHLDMVLLHEVRHAHFKNSGYTDLFEVYKNLEEAVNEFIDGAMRGVVKIDPRSKRFRWKDIEF